MILRFSHYQFNSHWLCTGFQYIEGLGMTIIGGKKTHAFAA